VLSPRQNALARLPEPQIIEGFANGRVSVIMPAFNEAKFIAKSVMDAKERFSLHCGDLEIIVVNDGSTDETEKIVSGLPHSWLRIVGYGTNQGKGFAIKKGFYSVTGGKVFLLDSDLEVKTKQLDTYLAALGSSDIVIGSKRHPRSRVRTPVMRRFLSIGFNVLERLLTGVNATDTQAGLKAMNSATLYRIVPLLSVKKYAFDAELLAVATLMNFRIRELPVEIDLKATFDAKQVFRMLIDLLGIAYRLRIRKWYQKNLRLMSSTYDPIISW
jgi:glycosyltransferase involved in cell wall biosynthesis